MSKFNKFVNHPNWFFKDAFKKREHQIANKLDLVNDNLKKFGIPIQLDIQIIEQSFVKTAAKLSHNNIISQKIVKFIDTGRGSIKKLESPKLSVLQRLNLINLNQLTPYITVKHSFEISLSPNNLNFKNVQSNTEHAEESSSKVISNNHTNIVIKNSLPLAFSDRTKQLFSRLSSSN